MSFTRVSKNQKCPICDKGTWCLIGTDAAICMRVYSDNRHVFKDQTVGWFHQIKDAVAREYVKQEKPPEIDAARIMEGWRRRERSQSPVNALAENLGVRRESLARLGCVWAPEHNAYAFPMFNGGGNHVGIRLRSFNGDKWAVKGSRQGLFLPTGQVPPSVVVCEGPTDAAAALSIGLYPIGRPSCCGGVPEIQEFIKRNRVLSLVIISDDDEPGLRGASVLSEAVNISSAILVMPAKDMRSFVNAGGTKEIFTSLLASVVWNRKDTNEVTTNR